MKSLFKSLTPLLVILLSIVSAYFGHAAEIHNHVAYCMGGIGLAMVIPSYSGAQRAIYDALQQRYGQLNNFKNVIIEPSYLRIQNLTTVNNTYTFDIINGTAGFSPVENRLLKNDVFVMTHMAIYLVQYPAVANVPSSWFAQLDTYPNNSQFVGVTTPKMLNTIYQGYFSISVGRVTYFKRFPTQHMQYVAITQQTSATTWSNREYTYGGVKVDPMIFLSGAADNQIQLTIPITGSTITDVGSTSATHIVFHPYGFVAAGCATYESDYQNLLTQQNS